MNFSLNPFAIGANTEKSMKMDLQNIPKKVVAKFGTLWKMRSHISNLVKELKEVEELIKYDTVVKGGRYYRVVNVDAETITLKEAETMEDVCKPPSKPFTLRKDEFISKKYRKLKAAPVKTYTLSPAELEKL